VLWHIFMTVRAVSGMSLMSGTPGTSIGVMEGTTGPGHEGGGEHDCGKN
jgi:hypothetical protein